MHSSVCKVESTSVSLYYTCPLVISIGWVWVGLVASQRAKSNTSSNIATLWLWKEPAVASCDFKAILNQWQVRLNPKFVIVGLSIIHCNYRSLELSTEFKSIKLTLSIAAIQVKSIAFKPSIYTFKFCKIFKMHRNTRNIQKHIYEIREQLINSWYVVNPAQALITTTSRYPIVL